MIILIGNERDDFLRNIKIFVAQDLRLRVVYSLRIELECGLLKRVHNLALHFLLRSANDWVDCLAEKVVYLIHFPTGCLECHLTVYIFVYVFIDPVRQVDRLVKGLFGQACHLPEVTLRLLGLVVRSLLIGLCLLFPVFFTRGQVLLRIRQFLGGLRKISKHLNVL